MVTSAAQELVDLLLRMNEVPIEHGAMALFEFIAGGSPLTADSEEVVVVSVARLWTPFGWPLALVTERIHAQFLAVYPPPWPLPSEIPCVRQPSRRA